ncbi:hypothetical protein DSECCO2_241880 [anaerobic digester metagenome]
MINPNGIVDNGNFDIGRTFGNVPGPFSLNYIQVPVPVVGTVVEIVKRIIGHIMYIIHWYFLDIFKVLLYAKPLNHFIDLIEVFNFQHESSEQFMIIVQVKRAGHFL